MYDTKKIKMLSAMVAEDISIEEKLEAYKALADEYSKLAEYLCDLLIKRGFQPPDLYLN